MSVFYSLYFLPNLFPISSKFISDFHPTPSNLHFNCTTFGFDFGATICPVTEMSIVLILSQRAILLEFLRKIVQLISFGAKHGHSVVPIYYYHTEEPYVGEIVNDSGQWCVMGAINLGNQWAILNLIFSLKNFAGVKLNDGGV